MPHCILEYSSNVLEKNKHPEALENIHKVLNDTGLFQLADIKSRAVEYKDYLIGDGDKSRAFVALTISILRGRSNEIKKAISSACIDALKSVYAKSFAKLKLSITVQIQEMDMPSYSRANSF